MCVRRASSFTLIPGSWETARSNDKAAMERLVPFAPLHQALAERAMHLAEEVDDLLVAPGGPHADPALS